jgi:DUF971 family protein
MAEEQKYQAVGLSPVGRYALGVCWGDGHESIFSFSYLRTTCPCEECRTAGKGEEDLPLDSTTLSRIDRLGRESLFLVWEDGHETLFLTEELRELCRCAQCKGEPDYPITGERKPL